MSLEELIDEMFDISDIHDKIAHSIAMGILIIRSYGEVCVSCEHDEIFVCHTPDNLPHAMFVIDVQKLKEMGWHYDDDVWSRYV